MKNNILNYIINEELNKFLQEYVKDDDVDWDLYENRSIITSDILNDFLFNNNSDFTKEISWRVIPYSMLKKVWEDYMKYGFLRSTKPLDIIERIMTNNTLKLDILTELQGHTPVNPNDTIHEYFDPIIDNYIQYKKQKPHDKNQLEIDFEKGSGQGVEKQDTTYYPDSDEKKIFDFFDKTLENNSMDLNDMDVDELKEKLYNILLGRFYDYYTESSKTGQPYLSDYGLEPLQKLLIKLRNISDENIGEKIITIDKMLNVVHPRSDLAELFVQGGSNALANLSASPSERKKENDES